MLNDWANIGHQKTKIAEGNPEGGDPILAVQCPTCMQHKTPLHVWTYQSPEMREAAALQLCKFLSFIGPVKSAPLLLSCLMAGLRRGTLGAPIPKIHVPESDTLGRLIHQAVVE